MICKIAVNLRLPESRLFKVRKGEYAVHKYESDERVRRSGLT